MSNRIEVLVNKKWVVVTVIDIIGTAIWVQFPSGTTAVYQLGNEGITWRMITDAEEK